MNTYLFALRDTQDDGVWIEASSLDEAQEIAKCWTPLLLWEVPKRIGMDLTKEWIIYVSKIDSTSP